MWSYASLTLRALVIFFLSLSSSVKANHENHYYSKGDLMPVTCLNRTLETGEHITDAHGNLQYIPFPTCAETNAPLAFAFGTPQTQTCTIAELADELYHLLEFFVHSDVPLTCRVPTYPLLSPSSNSINSINGGEDSAEGYAWTALTIALHGTLQFSHLHLHTNINGAKVMRTEPLTLTFNVGWIDGAAHTVGFSLLSFFACAASAGVGAMGMLVYERRNKRSSIYSNGILGGNIGGFGSGAAG
ncbi:hypothetical protein DV737_g3075, partial [Chaetothyriales sp. CBS 132003]